MTKTHSSLALILTLCMALSACGGNGGDHGNPTASGPTPVEAGEDLPLPVEDEDLAGPAVGSDEAFAEDSDFAEDTAASSDADASAEPVVSAPESGAAGGALVGNNLQTAKNLVDEAYARTRSLLAESNEYFAANAAGNRAARNVMRNNVGRMEINLRRAVRILSAWYDRGSSSLNNTARFRSDYSRLRAALRRTHQLGRVLHSVARRNDAIATFDSQATAIVNGADSALDELNTVIGRVRAPSRTRGSR